VQLIEFILQAQNLKCSCFIVDWITLTLFCRYFQPRPANS